MNGEPEALITWVYTDDLEGTCTFYATTLGLECTRDEGAARIYRVTAGAGVGVCRASAERVVEPRGTMITFVTDDVDGWYARLTAAGVVTRGAPHRLDEFGIYTFFAEDPNGYVIEFQAFLDA